MLEPIDPRFKSHDRYGCEGEQGEAIQRLIMQAWKNFVAASPSLAIGPYISKSSSEADRHEGHWAARCDR
ncbi:hypothetical protein HPP92_022035 [Vanilla planifolia]|uniref:Uncharacterized protein n=1 Tax=Vanilla planifolia TaxID=51239 RepID=A0A835PZS9_VANPL|nr:hypothetical protein HPP92_022375 [Vanilla planifolia]KAG0458907.1 hypothetical protein HPP92_022035 [Vanilla planifolia]